MKSTVHLFVHEYSEGSLPHAFDVRNLSWQNHSSKNRHLQLFGNLSTFPSAFGAHFCPPLGVSVLIRLVIHGKSVVNQWRIPVRFSLMLTWADLLARVTCRWVSNVKETWEDYGRLIFHDSGWRCILFLWVHCYGTILFILREVLEHMQIRDARPRHACVRKHRPRQRIWQKSNWLTRTALSSRSCNQGPKMGSKMQAKAFVAGWNPMSRV